MYRSIRTTSFPVISRYHKLLKATLFVIFLLCVPAMALAQTQLGDDIEGENDYDYLRGVSLSADGNRLAVSSENNDGANGTDSGHARVYQWSGTAWTQMGADIDGEAEYDLSGVAISLSAEGNRVAIGARWNDGGGDRSGHVRVYQWSGTAWTQMGTDIDGEAPLDESGSAVSLSPDGNRVAIAAWYNDGNGNDSGHVRIFEWVGSDWVQLGADIDGEQAGDQNSSVSLSSDGSRVAIGADRNSSDNGAYSGHVRVFEWANESWTQLGADIDGKLGSDWSGKSVSLSADGDRVAFGAWGNSTNGGRAGQVRVYHWDGAAWVQVGEDIDGEAAGDYFGNSVSLSADGNRLAAGGWENDGNGNNAGHVRIFEWSGSSWIQVGTDIDGVAEGDKCGHTVSLAANGNRVAMSSDGFDGDVPYSNIGHARAFDLCAFFEINPGLNDHWYNPLTVGQGVYITVLPDLGKVTLTIFTYDTVLPPVDLAANLGDPSQRWLNATGRYSGNQATMNIAFDYDGIFDNSTETTKVRGYGTIILSFCNCNSGTLEYEIPSLGLSGTVPIERIAGDNIALCEAFIAEMAR